MNSDLVFRRQFLLARERVSKLMKWYTVQLGEKLVLHCHPDLEVSDLANENARIILIGRIFDYRDYNKLNPDILSDILSSCSSFDEFLTGIKKYCGRFIFIYLQKGICNILSDPLAVREIYYCTKVNNVICGSQPNLLNDFSDINLGINDDKSIRDFYENIVKTHGAGDVWIGDDTYFNNIKHLLPNHYLDINNLKAFRYWPNNTIKKRQLNDVVDLSCEFLKGVLSSMTSRYPSMMAVTAGLDTRTLLSASKDLTDRFYFFINKEKHLNDKSADITVPQKLFRKLNLSFNVHEIADYVDPQFREIFLNNTFLSSERIITTVYNIYFKKLSNLQNICGIGEIGRTRYGKEPKKLNGRYLAYKIGYKEAVYAVTQCDLWLEKNLTTARKFGLNPLTLFYWEQKLGNWGSVGRSESDIAIEEVNPYNSHYLLELFLGVEDQYTTLGNNKLFREIIKKMWPEILNFPINPPDTFTKHIKSILINLGVYKYLQYLKFRYF